MKQNYPTYFRAAEREIFEANRCAGTLFAPMHRQMAEMFLELADQQMEKKISGLGPAWEPWPQDIRWLLDRL